MCGICFIIYGGKLTNNDEKTINNIIQFTNSFNDESPNKDSSENSLKMKEDNNLLNEGKK